MGRCPPWVTQCHLSNYCVRVLGRAGVSWHGRRERARARPGIVTAGKLYDRRLDSPLGGRACLRTESGACGEKLRPFFHGLPRYPTNIGHEEGYWARSTDLQARKFRVNLRQGVGPLSSHKGVVEYTFGIDLGSCRDGG
eukprot:755326-Hanusia_phi.AAC.1